MRLHLTITIALFFTLPAWAAHEITQPHVVELFTSQGCNSCPPADALLGELSVRPDVIALAFHVDYWDSLGWRDRFSMAEATWRQNRYVDALNLSSAFTPQIVIDGRLSLVGSDRKRIAAALSQPLAANIQSLIGLRIIDGELRISLAADTLLSQCDVNLAAYVPKTATAIGRGENAGKTLVEYNVVLQLRRLGTCESAGAGLRMPLDSLPADASHVAILLQDKEQALTGAASIALR